jgi:hypothetical protein
MASGPTIPQPPSPCVTRPNRTQEDKRGRSRADSLTRLAIQKGRQPPPTDKYALARFREIRYPARMHKTATRFQQQIQLSKLARACAWRMPC